MECLQVVPAELEEVFPDTDVGLFVSTSNWTDLDEAVDPDTSGLPEDDKTSEVDQEDETSGTGKPSEDHADVPDVKDVPGLGEEVPVLAAETSGLQGDKTSELDVFLEEASGLAELVPGVAGIKEGDKTSELDHDDVLDEVAGLAEVDKASELVDGDRLEEVARLVEEVNASEVDTTNGLEEDASLVELEEAGALLEVAGLDEVAVVDRLKPSLDASQLDEGELDEEAAAGLPLTDVELDWIETGLTGRGLT